MFFAFPSPPPPSFPPLLLCAPLVDNDSQRSVLHYDQSAIFDVVDHLFTVRRRLRHATHRFLTDDFARAAGDLFIVLFEHSLLVAGESPHRRGAPAHRPHTPPALEEALMEIF